MDNLQYTTTEPLRWDAIAQKAYGDETKSDIIIQANPRVAITDVVPSGTVLSIPVLPESEVATDLSLLPPWKQ